MFKLEYERAGKPHADILQEHKRISVEFFGGVVAEWPVVLLYKQTRIFMQPITEALRLL